MYGAARRAVDVSFAEKGRGNASFIEVTKYANIDDFSPSDFRYGKLKDAEIAQWIEQSGRYQPTKASSGSKDVVGGLRILLCERAYGLKFDLDLETYTTLESKFHLPAATIPTLANEAGTYSRHFTYDKSDINKVTRIGIIIKMPQKREIANYGLSMSYDLDTGCTTAFIFASEIMTPFETRNSESRAIKYSPRCSEAQHRVPKHDLTDKRADDKVWSASKIAMEESSKMWHTELGSVIADFYDAWAHPTCLPCIILTDHMRRTKHFCEWGKPMQLTWEIERDLGVTSVGSPYAFVRGASSAYSVQHIDRAKAEELTVRINTQSTRILFTSRSPELNRRCSEYMLAVHNMLPKLGSFDQLGGPVHSQLAEVLEFNIHQAEAVRSHVEGMKARMALQLNVLYSVVAQEDNRLSARLAASSGKDSTSMKILAFITALFLPGTFVATLFSMGMFAWRFDNGTSANGTENSSTVSNQFWIYWATALPLTAVTLIGWALWWQVEMRVFRKAFAEALDEAETVPAVGGTAEEGDVKLDRRKRRPAWLKTLKIGEEHS
ncbi:hypothetical protein NA57DRAFT_78886 [Rhizodiscina lignyota]|uniref:Uncharacterized protein n=1 Tax=Rhizodiscina lignyota TaxID=1504668 RepID=A0A9P4M7T1_9PEZI|nr:hypothetical protein NA57DRAFT_78886 [Rhizodiscina lignyota]